MYSMSHEERLFYDMYDRLCKAINLSADGNLTALKNLVEYENFDLAFCWQEYRLSAVTIASMQGGKGAEIMVEYLLKKGAKPTFEALCRFAEEGNVSAMRKLIAWGLPINSSKEKQTILDFCLQLAKEQKTNKGGVDPRLEDVFEFLLARGAKTTAELKAEGNFAKRRAIVKKEAQVRMAKKSIKRQQRKTKQTGREK